MSSQTAQAVQGTLFEEDFLLRSLGAIAHSADVALTELVANAWDAGASEVRISIPDDHDLPLIVEDDGCGMTSEQFRTRWMTLGYNRVKHQGRKAEFPPERQDWRRISFGQNGVGRHGLLCFADRYEVDTSRDGSARRFLVTTASGDEPFVLESETEIERAGHGTLLRAGVVRNLPSPDRIRDVLSARFLHDPKFTVYVNGKNVPLAEHPGLIDHVTLNPTDSVSLDIVFIDSMSAARTIRHQGVAFWVGGRLVGEPDWNWGKRMFIDGRTHFAKRYTVVVKTDDLFDEVQPPDWAGFRRSELMEKVYDAVEQYVRDMFQKVSSEKIQETKETVLREHLTQLKALPPKSRYEVAEFVEELAREQPTMQPETISHAVRAMINLEESHSGSSLLEKLAALSEEDIEGLDRLLSEWTVHDALTVLDAIDRRIATIEAIDKLSQDSSTEELHTLHPLVTQARWLFGAGFESEEYASNLSLKNAVQIVFQKRVEGESFINHKRRPDLVLLKDASLSAVGLDRFDRGGTLLTMQDVLLIELKKGKSTIGRDEMYQALNYVQDLLGCGALDGSPYIRAFVVGHTIHEKVEPVLPVGRDPERGEVRAASYAQLVRTGRARLFKLRENLQSRYEDVKGTDLLARVLDEPAQMLMFNEKDGASRLQKAAQGG
jgi:hypothetical protein